MIYSQRPKYIRRKLLIHSLLGLFFTLQITACSTNNPADTIADKSISQASETSTTQEDTDITNLAEINLSWAAPSERENNVPISLSEIAGYKVYYGTSEGSYTNSVYIDNGSADGYSFKNFSSGTYYFALTTYDTAGRESTYSSEIKIVV